MNKNGFAKKLAFSFLIICFMGFNCKCQSASEKIELNDFMTKVWVDAGAGLLDLNVTKISIYRYAPALVAAMTPSTVYISTNNGRTWNAVLESRDIQSNSEVVEESRKEIELEISKDDYDEDELREDNILEENEDFEDLTDDELKERLLDAGIIEEELEEDEEITESGELKEANQFLDLAWSANQKDDIFVLTNYHIMRSTNQGRTWTETDIENLNPKHFAVIGSQNNLILINKKNAYYSFDQGNQFVKVNEVSSTEQMKSIIPYRENKFLVLTSNRIIVGEGNQIEESFDFSPAMAFEQLEMMCTHPNGNFYVASNNQLYQMDSDKQWSQLSIDPIKISTLTDIDSLDGKLVIGTNRGCYIYDPIHGEGVWFNTGLTELDIQDLDGFENHEQYLWAATSAGPFFVGSFTIESFKEPEFKAKKTDTDLPNFTEILMVALRYAECDAELNKIWIEKAKHLRWLPKDFELKFAAYTDDDTDYWKNRQVSLSGGNIILGPYDETWETDEDEDFKSELKASWYPQKYLPTLESSKFIRDQIKRRHKLIKRVNDLYYNLAEISDELEKSLPFKRKCMKYIEYMHLIASLDALTGNYFSENYNHKFN